MAGTDFVGNFGAGLAVEIVKAVGQQACYCYQFKELVTNLGDEQKNLVLTTKDMERQLDKDKANSKEPSGVLQQQLNTAKDLIDKVDKLKEKVEAEAKRSCCHGVCSNWICRCILGGKAEKKVEAMKRLNDKLREKLLSAHRLSLRCMLPSEDFILFQCTIEAKNKILTALRDDTKIRIGLCGMGGCGKTSLLNVLHCEMKDAKLYKTAFTTVSQALEHRVVQNSIASWIGLDFEREENVPERAARLSMAFAKDKKYLIILDDVWQVLNFNDIGIPVRENCKVLLSTRKRHILDLMKFEEVIDMSLLTTEEAEELFRKHSGEIKDTFKQVAKEITKECHRLPVAIKAVASTLRGKELYAWKDALKTLKDRRQPLDIEEGLQDPYRCLKYSFDELRTYPEEESLYLLCALFPNNSEIAIEALIRFAFGLGIFLDIISYERARCKARTAIDKFKNYCMLLQEGQYVKLHDMFHALALWEANKKRQVVMGPEQIVALTKAIYMKDTKRLYCHGIEAFPDQLNCPELEILIVSNNGGYSSKFPHLFFKKMEKLKVLAIKNTSIVTKSKLLLPQSTEGLKTLRTLCLRGWILTDISVFEKLEMLDTIELVDCVMKELPKELANLKALKLLDVSKSKIGGNPYEVLATCSHLEELYFVENNLPEMVQLGQEVAKFFHQIGSFRALQRYHLEFGGSINTSKGYSSSKLISINNFDASITKEALQALSLTLQVLFFEKIKGDCKSIIPDLFPIQGECLKELEEFVLRDSDCIRFLIDTTNDQLHQTRILFAKLHKLKVEAMECLEALCHGPPPSGLFDYLKELSMTNCSQLAFLFTTTTAKKMAMLEELEVIDCGKLRHIIIAEEDEDISIEPVLPHLKHISIKRCENLECILPISVASVLESLEIEDAAKLLYVFGEDNHEKDQNQNQISVDLSSVDIFKLVNLPLVISIFPQSYDVKLPLDKAVVTGCPNLKGIDLDSEGRQEDGDKTTEQVELLSVSSGKDPRFNSRVRTAKGLVQATARRARNFLRFNTFITDLSNEKDLLRSKLEGISGDLYQLERVAEARDLIKEVDMLERKAEASKSYCHGVFPNWLCQYILGKRLERMTKTVKQLNESLTLTPNRTSSQPRITGQNDFFTFESRRLLYDEILKELKDDEIYMVGLYGMGGCGKTSLIAKVCHEVSSLKLFDKVAFVVASDHPDIRRIQGGIADSLGLKFNSDEIETERAARLSMKLSNGEKFLIVLDDMWEVLKLEDVGIPLGKNCKVFLTTRNQHLCTMMDCQRVIYLSLLSEQESCFLFRECTGVTQDTLEDLVLELARECRGLPLAIVAVAKALKHRPEVVWKEALETLRNHRTTNKSSAMENVYSRLKLSIDGLGNDEARSLFFLCALFPEDSNIAIEILIRFAIGLGILEDVNSYESARIKVRATIDKLIDSFLLLKVDENGQNCRMHDVVRDVALELSKEIQLIMGPENSLVDSTEGGFAEDTKRLYCHDINEYPDQLNCPKLEFLFVSNNGGYSSDFPNTFFIKTRELMVLTITNTSTSTIPNLLLPQSMDGLKKLRTVCLRGWTLENISILGKLEMLDTIELLSCVIKELPKELAELRRLSLLEVSGCKIGSNPFEVLTRSSQLEELYFLKNSLPETLSNDHYVKLLRQIGSSKLLRRYHLQIGSSIGTLENYLITKFMSINGFNISTLKEEMKNIAQKLEVLFWGDVQGDFKNILPDMIPIDRECMNELTEFLLHDSDNIECLIDITNHHQARIVFSRLLKLKIKTMKRFKALCCGPPPFNLFEKLEKLFIVECSQLQCIVSAGKLNFCSLKNLQLEDCPNLTSIFTYSTAQTMVFLETLTVRGCISLEQIIKDEEEGRFTPRGPIFPELKQLYVKGCPYLEFIVPASFLGGLSQLESLEIENAGLLKHVFGKYEREKDQNQRESCRRIDLPVLRILKLVELPNITGIFPQSYHIRWPDAAKLYMKGCPQLSIPSELDSEAIQQGGGMSMDQELELLANKSSNMIMLTVEEIKQVGEAAVGNPSVDSLSSTMASVSSEVVAIHQYEAEPSHIGSTHSNEDRDEENQRANNDIPSGSFATGSNFHLLKQDVTAAEVHPHSPESEIVDTQEGLQKKKFCPVDPMNQREELIEKKALVLTDPQQALQDNEVLSPSSGISTHSPTSEALVSSPTKQQEMAEELSGLQGPSKEAHLPDEAFFKTTVPHQQKRPEDDSHNKVQEAANIHFAMNVLSNKEITKGSIQRHPTPKESTTRTSSQELIEKQPQVELELSQIVTCQKQAPPQNKVLSPSQPVPPKMPTSEASTSSLMEKHPIAEELSDFHGVSRCACLLDEAFIKYPHLSNWKISQKSPRYCNWGYESLTDMLELLKSEKPKTMDDSKWKKFEDLCFELESFGFDNEWLASISKRVTDMQVNYNDKLNQLVQLKSDVSSMEDQLDVARARMDSIEHDLSKLDDVFGL